MSAIHPTAIVDPQARLAADVQVGPYSVIGPHVTIGGGTTIGQRALSYYYNGVGDTSFLAPMANYRPEKH